MPIQVSIKNLAQINKKFETRKWLLSGSQMKTVNKMAAITLDQWVQKNFEAKGRNHKNPMLAWKPVSAKYAERKRKKGGDPNAILRDTGRLKNSFDIMADSKKAVLRNKVPYAWIHEHGSQAKGMPRRKIFPTIKHGNEIVLPVYAHYMNRVARGK